MSDLDVKTLKTAYLVIKRRPSKERIKQALDTVKQLMIDENCPLYRERLAETGLMLNELFLK